MKLYFLKEKLKIIFTLCLTISIAFAVYCQRKNINKMIKYSTGFYKIIFEDVNPNDAVAASSAWFNEMERSANYKTFANFILYNDFNDLLRNYEKDNLGTAIVSTYDYLTSPKKEIFNPIYAPSILEQSGTSYFLIVKKDKNYRSIKDLHDLSLGITTSNINIASKLWLDVLLFKNKLPTKDKFFSSVIKNSKDSKNIIDVFFGKLEVCLVNQISFELMSELNPQTGKQSVVLIKSPTYINGIVCFTDIIKDKTIADEIKDKINTIGKYESGRQILKLIKIDKLAPFKNEYLTSYKELLEDYDKIKN